MTGAWVLALALGAARPGGAPEGCRAAVESSERLGAWCATLAARPRLPLPSAADRRALLEVLDRPELRRARADPSGLRRLLLGYWARFLELLGSAEAERYASVGRLTFIVAGATALLAAAAAAKRRRRRLRGPTDEADAEPRASLRPADRSAWLAEVALARGDLAGAVRYALLAAVAALEGAGRLPRDRSLTNRELATRLGPSTGDPDAEDFSALAALFDRMAYGGASVGELDARDGLARALRIGRRVGAPP
jgi:hypothetical protein